MEGLTLFKTPSIYLVIEGYLFWRDFLHIAQTCRELYYNWVSKDPTRWKDLVLPNFIYKCILGLEITETDNPIESIRERALESLISNNTYYYYPCMGRCGKRVFEKFVVSRYLPYALCVGCARFQSICFLNMYLIRNNLTKNAEGYLTHYITALVGAEKFTENRDKIFDFWSYGYVKCIRKKGWLIPIYSIRDVENRAKDLLSKLNL